MGGHNHGGTSRRSLLPGSHLTEVFANEGESLRQAEHEDGPCCSHLTGTDQPALTGLSQPQEPLPKSSLKEKGKA